MYHIFGVLPGLHHLRPDRKTPISMKGAVCTVLVLVGTTGQSVPGIELLPAPRMHPHILAS